MCEKSRTANVLHPESPTHLNPYDGAEWPRSVAEVVDAFLHTPGPDSTEQKYFRYLFQDLLGLESGWTFPCISV